MEQTVVKAELGRKAGSRPSRRLRAEGKLPGIVYGLGQDPESVTVDYASLRSALNNPQGMNTVFTLEIEGKAQTVLVHQVQRDPIKRLVTHADFLRVDPNKKVRVKVPVRLAGAASAVTEQGGLVEQKRFEIELEVAPDAIPEFIEADISNMTFERRVAVSDLELPEGARAVLEEHLTVVAPVMTRSAKASANEDGKEGGEGEAGEEAAAE
jgi:large subunit ribosomal protein L25